MNKYKKNRMQAEMLAFFGDLKIFEYKLFFEKT